jgi:hypothetical protein
MRKSAFSHLLLCTVLSVAVLQSCKDDSYLAAAPPIPDQSFVEEFDTLSTAYAKGWRFVNRSENIGTTNWTQGSIGGTLVAFSSKGTNAGFISSDYQATAGAANTISNWAISPSITMQNFDTIVFYTMADVYAVTGGSTDYANRLQVCINTHNDGLNVGEAENPGDFDRVILDINPTYEEQFVDAVFGPTPNAYPHVWTRFEAVVTGLSKPMKARFAFRYFLEEAGTAGRGSEVGVDMVTYKSKK